MVFHSVDRDIHFLGYFQVAFVVKTAHLENTTGLLGEAIDFFHKLNLQFLFKQDSERVTIIRYLRRGPVPWIQIARKTYFLGMIPKIV